MRRGGPKVELATHRYQVNGLPPKSAPDAIKFRPVQPPQPQMCPVERAEICDFRSIINGLLLFKEGSWVSVACWSPRPSQDTTDLGDRTLARFMAFLGQDNACLQRPLTARPLPS